MPSAAFVIKAASTMQSLLLLLGCVGGAAAAATGPVPDMDGDWVSVSPGVEFQLRLQPEIADPRKRAAFEHARQRFLSGSSNEYENQFIDGTETYYNDYAQAWRLLGFYVDCNAPHNNYNECNGEGGNRGDDEEPACQRFLMWAAYIDLDYQGGGIGEYQFYDRTNDAWDDTSCIANDGRCAKMDCHLKDTSFTLLGFFKEPNYHEWMEQLFKHEGVCLWTDDEYNYMQTDRKLWPCDCTSAGSTDEKGNELYYDTRPLVEGRIGLGLYTDSRCSKDYMGNLDIDDVLAHLKGRRGRALKENNGDVYTLEQGLSLWNDAFDVFKVCQPCKAYNLGYHSDVDYSKREGGGDDGDAAFDCADDAGYTDVNQCMKFRTKTEMLTAGFRDIMLAHQQGTIVEMEVLGTTYGYGGYRQSGGMVTEFSMEDNSKSINPWSSIWLAGSILFCLGSCIYYIFVRKDAQESATSLETPLFDANDKGELM